MTITADHIRTVLDDYLDAHPEEQASVSAVYALLDDGADLTSRKEFRGHSTAGAILLDPDDRVLLVHHRALDRWLLPGGHLEPEDATLQAAAVRELAEETGIHADAVTALGALPMQVNVHPIPANPAKHEPDHQHFDFRFAFRTTADVRQLQSDEVIDAAWRGIDSLEPVLRERLEDAGRARSLRAGRQGVS